MAAIDTYRRGLRSNVRALWTGVVTVSQFSSEMTTLINRRLTQAFDQGTRECNIMPNEQSPQEQLALGRAIQTELTFVPNLAQRVIENDKESGGKLSPLLSSLEAWTLRFLDLQNRGRELACADKKLEWVIDLAKDNCNSCLKLNGKVKRGSFWKRVGVHPQRPENAKLICLGFNCGCTFMPTNKSISRGPLPRLP